MKRILVTGATGFVGRHAIAPLIAKGYEVHAVSSKQPAATQHVQWHRADLLDGREVARLMAALQPTHLLHFAWYAEPGKFWKSPQNYRWLESSIGLLRHFREFGGQRVVMAGTCAEYDWSFGYCSESITPCRPATPYGVCKNVLQDTLRSYGDQEALSSAWGRVFFLYGPHEHPAKLVSSVITSLLQGGRADCTHGAQVRDFMHVEDVASAFVALLDSNVQGAVNIASGHPVSLSEVVLAAADHLGARERVNFGAIPAPENDPPLLVGDNRRLSDEVGWHPRYDLRSGIEQTVNWWESKLEQGN